MSSMCEQVCIILTVILGMTILNVIGWKSYGDVGAEHLNDQQNHGKILLGKLRRSGMYDPIVVDVIEYRIVYRTRVLYD